MNGTGGILTERDWKVKRRRLLERFESEGVSAYNLIVKFFVRSCAGLHSYVKEKTIFMKTLEQPELEPTAALDQARLRLVPVSAPCSSSTGT